MEVVVGLGGSGGEYDTVKCRKCHGAHPLLGVLVLLLTYGSNMAAAVPVCWMCSGASGSQRSRVPFPNSCRGSLLMASGGTSQTQEPPRRRWLGLRRVLMN